MTHNYKYVLYKDGDEYVIQCLNVDICTQGPTVEEAIANLNEAVELYFADNKNIGFLDINMAMIGESRINV